MHILIIPSWYPRYPGDIIGSFFREQAIALRKHGCKVGVISPTLRSLRDWRLIFSRSKSFMAELDEGVITYRSSGMNWFPRTFVPTSKLFSLQGLRLFELYIAENGIPDVVHVHSLLFAGCVAKEILKKYKIPYVVTEHSSQFLRKTIHRKGLIMAKNLASSASRRFAVSQEFASYISKSLKSKNELWEYVPNIVNDIFVSQELNPHLGNQDFEFINVALMDENKMQKNIIQAFAILDNIKPNVRLTIVGDGPERKNLEKLARDLNVADKVVFTGLLPREKVMALMMTASALVLSSRHETFGVVVIEALALGKPVIATLCGGPESIVRKEDGLLVPVDDIVALNKAMNELIANYKIYDPVEIRQSCRDRFGERAVVVVLKKIYAEVMSSRYGINKCM